MGTRRAPEGGAAGAAGSVRLNLLSGFELLVDGDEVAVPPSAQRVVAYLALQSRPRPRTAVAASLWLDVDQERAAANLRAALWKLRHWRNRVIGQRADQLSLAPHVDVDLTALIREAHWLLDASRRGATDDVTTSGERDRGYVDLLSRDLLPAWDEEWITFERERLRQLRLHAIESLSVQLRSSGRFAEAIEAGLAAVSADPLRESAQRVLIDAFLAEGNLVDARRQFEAYRHLLWKDLRADPSPELRARVGLPAVGRQRDEPATRAAAGGPDARSRTKASSSRAGAGPEPEASRWR